jgi:hypothetical protein
MRAVALEEFDGKVFLTIERRRWWGGKRQEVWWAEYVNGGTRVWWREDNGAWAGDGLILRLEALRRSYSARLRMLDAECGLEAPALPPKPAAEPVRGRGLPPGSIGHSRSLLESDYARLTDKVEALAEENRELRARVDDPSRSSVALREQNIALSKKLDEVIRERDLLQEELSLLTAGNTALRFASNPKVRYIK